MDVYIVKYSVDYDHPKEYYIDSIWEDLEDAEKRLTQLKIGPWAPYDCWIEEDYVVLRGKGN